MGVEWQEVAVKKFMNQDISGDALVQFKCEVGYSFFIFLILLMYPHASETIFYIRFQ